MNPPPPPSSSTTSSSTWLTKASHMGTKRRFASDWDSYEVSTLSHRSSQRSSNADIVSFGQRPLNSNTNDHAMMVSSGCTSRNVNHSTNQSFAHKAVKEEVVSPEMQKFRGLCHKNPKPTVEIPNEIDGSTLNELQRYVVASVFSGCSVFFSGPAGSGKSFILRSILYLNENGSTLVKPSMRRKKNIVLTATTGIAACTIGGITIHSFAGVGTGEGEREDMVARVMRNDYCKKRWRETDILVIDEISMLPANFLDTLDFIATRVRNDRRPFGGLQLVLCGDFYQLPPVNLKSGFAFEATCWSKVIKCTVLLQEIYRQGGDSTLMNILNEARVGELSENSVDVLRAHSIHSNTPAGANAKHNGVKPTLLECRNTEVDRANLLEMNKLEGELYSFKAKDRLLNKGYTSILKNYQASETLTLKIGAQVILLKNIDPEKGLVNGARGVVVDFKVQSRTDTDLLVSWKKVELPVVKFESMLPGKDDDVLEVLVEPEEWSNKVGDQIVCARYQIPLRLAWCLSVHKSQGMTIPHLTVNLSGVFEYGQAYVALSRATKLSLLTLRGFDERNIRAHPKVKEYYKLIMMEVAPLSNISPNMLHPHQPNTSTIAKGGTSNKIRLAPVHNLNKNRGISPVFRNYKASDVASTITAVTTGVTPSPKTIMPSLTSEQQQRAELNRQRALEIRKRKLAAQTDASRSVSSAPLVGTHTNITDRSNNKFNPYQQR